MKTTIAFTFVAALVTVLRAQDAQTPSFRAGVEALPVDVSVIDDRGQPVRDLIAADFTVRVDGRARKVVSAQWIAAATAGPGAAAAPADGFVSNETTAYNLVAIPVAAGLFVRWGLDLPMSVGAVAMSLSTIIVAANAQLLRGLKLRPSAI